MKILKSLCFSPKSGGGTNTVPNSQNRITKLSPSFSLSVHQYSVPHCQFRVRGVQLLQCANAENDGWPALGTPNLVSA